MAPAIGTNLVRHVGLSKAAIGGKAKIVLAGHGPSSGLLGKAALSHCDGGIAGASALSFGCGSLWKGISLGGVGIGLALGQLAPILMLAAGVIASYGCLKYLRRHTTQNARQTKVAESTIQAPPQP